MNLLQLYIHLCCLLNNLIYFSPDCRQPNGEISLKQTTMNECINAFGLDWPPSDVDQITIGDSINLLLQVICGSHCLIFQGCNIKANLL